MGSRGAIGKSPALKALEGRRSHRSAEAVALDLNQRFRPEVGEPAMPRGLGKEARAAWRRLVPELFRYGLLATVDLDSLLMLVTAAGRVAVLERALAKRQAEVDKAGGDPAAALMIERSPGQFVRSAHFAALNTERTHLRLLLADFGLTPAQRARVIAGVRSKPRGVPGAEQQPEALAPHGFAGFE